MCSWQWGMNKEQSAGLGTLQGIQTGREVPGAVTHRCLVKAGRASAPHMLMAVTMAQGVTPFLGWLPAGSLGLWGTGSPGQSLLFPGIAGSCSITFISKPPATRGRKCHIFMASFACGDVFNEGIHQGFPGSPKAGFNPFIYPG